MTAILAQRDDEWFLAAFAPHIRGCNLSTVVPPRHYADKFHVWNGAVFVQSHTPLDGLRFFPLLYWHNMRVAPIAWEQCEVEPILGVFMDQIEVAGRTWEETEPRIRALEPEGWKYKPREGFFRSVHIDELEKIEGPAGGTA